MNNQIALFFSILITPSLIQVGLSLTTVPHNSKVFATTHFFLTLPLHLKPFILDRLKTQHSVPVSASMDFQKKFVLNLMYGITIREKSLYNTRDLQSLNCYTCLQFGCSLWCFQVCFGVNCNVNIIRKWLLQNNSVDVRQLNISIWEQCCGTLG